MTKLSTIALTVAMALPTIAQQPISPPVVLKGHHLGESIGEFLQSDAVAHQAYVDCSTNVPRKMTPDEAKSTWANTYVLFGAPDKGVGGVQMPVGVTSKNEAASLASQGMVYTKDQRSLPSIMWCGDIDSIKLKGEGTATLTPDNLKAVFGFHSGRIVKIGMNLLGSEFADVATDFNKRCGTEFTLTTPPMFNAAGARWNDEVATWHTADFIATLEHGRNPADESLYLTVTSVEYQKFLNEKKAQQKSPLDP